MNTSTSRYTFLFAFLLCICLSSMLSITHMLLRDTQQQSRLLDQQKNILIAAGLPAKTPEQVQQIFQQRVKPLVIDRKGNEIKGELPSNLQSNSSYLPLYRISSDSSLSSDKPTHRQRGERAAVAYVYPILGKGLWSVLRGYLAVSPDGRKIVGVAFFEHEETPGLGGEISKPWFQNHFVGKLLYAADRLVGIKVVKGKAKDHPSFSRQKNHLVDGISGATITGDGVTKMMYDGPMKYEPFFAKK